MDTITTIAVAASVAITWVVNKYFEWRKNKIAATKDDLQVAREQADFVVAQYRGIIDELQDQINEMQRLSAYRFNEIEQKYIELQKKHSDCERSNEVLSARVADLEAQIRQPRV